MGNQLFGVDIAEILLDAMGDGLFRVSIERAVEGDRDPDNLTGGRAVEPETVEAIGFWDDFTGSPPPGVTIELGDRKLVLLGDSIPTGGHPRRNDKCTVHEDDGDVAQFCVGPISRDPAAAVFTYQCRDRITPPEA